MYNATLEKRVLESLARKSANVSRLARLPLVHSHEEGKFFMEGLQKMAKMDEEEWEKVKGLTSDEIEKGWEDKDVRVAVAYLAMALKSVEDGLQGRAHSNPALHRVANREKAFHNNILTNTERLMVSLDEQTDIVDGSYFDMGWSQAFRSVAALGAQKVKVSDMFGDLIFEELEDNEEPKAISLGSKSDQEVGFRRFGVAVVINDYNMLSAAFTANDVLALIRAASVRGITHAAWKEIFMLQAGTRTFPLVSKYNITAKSNKDAGWKEAANAIHTLNQAAYSLKTAAAGIPEDANKKAPQRTEARVNVSVGSPVLVYYNEAHFDLISRMTRLVGGEDGNNPRLEFPFVFIPTFQAPYSGGWDLVDAEAKDFLGHKGTVKESGTKNQVGVQIVIPQGRNLYLTFQGLTFGQDRRAAIESTIIPAFQRYNFAKDVRQSALVRLA